jgi:hypothetical protein
MGRLSPVSAARGNGDARLPGYAGVVRSWFAILVTLSACHDPAIERLTAIRDTVCACKTAACAEQAMAEVAQLGRDAPASPTAARRGQALARAMLDCLAKLHEADRPITDPDAEAPAGSAAEVSAPRTPAPASAGTP